MTEKSFCVRVCVFNGRGLKIFYKFSSLFEFSSKRVSDQFLFSALLPLDKASPDADRTFNCSFIFFINSFIHVDRFSLLYFFHKYGAFLYCIASGAKMFEPFILDFYVPVAWCLHISHGMMNTVIGPSQLYLARNVGLELSQINFVWTFGFIGFVLGSFTSR